jgi:hypothetical protein
MNSVVGPTKKRMRERKKGNLRRKGRKESLKSSIHVKKITKYCYRSDVILKIVTNNFFLRYNKN